MGVFVPLVAIQFQNGLVPRLTCFPTSPGKAAAVYRVL